MNLVRQISPTLTAKYKQITINVLGQSLGPGPTCLPLRWPFNHLPNDFDLCLCYFDFLPISEIFTLRSGMSRDNRVFSSSGRIFALILLIFSRSIFGQGSRVESWREQPPAAVLNETRCFIKQFNVDNTAPITS